MNSINEFVALQTPENRILIEKIRKIIKNTSPDIAEKYMYKCPFYTYKGYLLYINVHAHKVYIGLCNGHLHSDPNKLFHSNIDTKQVRKIFLQNITPEYATMLQDYIYESIAINDDLSLSKHLNKRK
ncbi:MAG: DUF1801 domain-containing protein [Cytophagales bacterium]|nr:DUF1801 domain-containing protein [Cytophagales bacterium]